MAAFRERKTFLENLTFMALMAAIVVIASVFAAFVPLGAVIVMIALPLPSAVVAYYCRPRYYIIYLFGAIGIAVAATSWNFSSTLFYTIPSVITGLLYGFLKQKGASIAESVFLVGLLNLGFSYLSILLIKAIYEVDMIAFLLGVLSLSDSLNAPKIVLAAMLAYSLVQASLSNLFINIQSQPLEKPERKWKGNLLYPVYGLALLSVMLILSFWEETVSYGLLTASVYWLVFSLADSLPFARKWIYAPLIFLFLLGAFFFYFYFQSLPLIKALLLFGCPIAGILIGVSLNNLMLFKMDANPTINE